MSVRENGYHIFVVKGTFPDYSIFVIILKGFRKI